MKTTRIGIDLAKSVFEVAVSRTAGQVQERHRLSRPQLSQFFAQPEPAEILMEACSSSHHWGRAFQAMGHHVALLHPGDVARYRDGNKTDRADAKASLEAARNEALDRVPVKSIDQQAITARLVPQARALLAETTLPAYFRRVLEDMLDEIETLKVKADSLTEELEQLARQMPDACLLMSVPGIGVLTASALPAFVGDIRRFRSGRHFAAYLGLTPREHSSGLSRRLGRITKRGNSYLRMMLIHGARAALRADVLAQQPDDLRAWALQVQQRSGHNIAAVALANKLARVCWRVWRDQQPFEPRAANT